MKSRDFGTRRKHGRALIATFAAAAALAGGAQALAPASAGAVTNEGNACAFATDWWTVFQCEITYGEIGPNGVGGGGTGADNAVDEPEEPGDDTSGSYTKGNRPYEPGWRSMGSDDLNGDFQKDPQTQEIEDDRGICLNALATELEAQANKSKLEGRLASRGRLSKRRERDLAEANRAIRAVRRDWNSYNCENVLGASSD